VSPLGRRVLPHGTGPGDAEGGGTNQAIREWIQANHQPWRVSPERSFLRGPIGSDRAFPLTGDARKYFERRGIPVEGRLYEDLQEAGLLNVLQTISSWLSAGDRRRLDETVAFGAALTYEPNACAMQCLDGYAILFDYSFDTLLISATELHHALVVPPRLITTDEFPLALNTAILSVFLNLVDYWTPIPDDGFAHREYTDSWVWLMSVFLLGHEVGHVMRNHLDGALVREAMFRSHPGGSRAAVLQPEHREEFEADQYAIELMLQGERSGGLMKPGTDRKVFWNSAYVTLGWLFTILAAIGALSRRLEIPIPDTHPPAADRWSRIDALTRDRAPIDRGTIGFAELMRGNALRSAEIGDLPTLRPEMPAEIEEYVAVPYSAALARLIRETRGDQPA
jgi:hypothetical protein